MNSISIPDVTTLTGCRNVATYYPDGPAKPDIGIYILKANAVILTCAYHHTGPKMYSALFDKGEYGSTRLHVDVADAWNVLVHASKGEADGFAEWVVFRREDAEPLAEFLREQGLSVGPGHPIHLQKIFLTGEILALLERTKGIRPYRIRQRQGDTVYIPVGCAHQVWSRFRSKNLNSIFFDTFCRSAIKPIASKALATLFISIAFLHARSLLKNFVRKILLTLRGHGGRMYYRQTP